MIAARRSAGAGLLVFAGGSLVLGNVQACVAAACLFVLGALAVLIVDGVRGERRH